MEDSQTYRDRGWSSCSRHTLSVIHQLRIPDYAILGRKERCGSRNCGLHHPPSRCASIRFGEAPLTQPDSLYINASKLPEAAKALDPGLDDATIWAWMKANGFEKEVQY